MQTWEKGSALCGTTRFAPSAFSLQPHCEHRICLSGGFARPLPTAVALWRNISLLVGTPLSLVSII